MSDTIETQETQSEHDSLIDDDIIDEASLDDAVVPERYDITSFGADYDVDGLVRRLDRGDVFIPPFQRDYVWTQQEASRFIESLLLGLPVPGVFLAREQESNRLLVIDGQQRLKTLQFFYGGFFNPRPENLTKRVFRLTKVQTKFDGHTFETLEEKDKVKLNDSIIHATIIKQDAPQDDDTSVYHIFERLNNGGRKLAAQEIRTAIYHGDMIDLVRNLNDYEVWRSIFGKKNPRLKDEELILRFLALYFNGTNYQRPMKEFLNRFAKRYIKSSSEFIDGSRAIFEQTINAICNSLGDKAFRPERALNAAVFDSVTVGFATRIGKNGAIDNQKASKAYNNLLKDTDYIRAVSQATSNENNVELRLTKAIEAFSSV